VEIRKVTIHLNLGDKLEISQGLSDSDQVIVNPSDGLAKGMKVSVIGPNQPPRDGAFRNYAVNRIN
jgi:hypothetical protein